MTLFGQVPQRDETDLGRFAAAQVDQVFARIVGRVPRGVDRLEAARARLGIAESPGDYQSVALLCRDALIDYGDSIFSPDCVPEGEQQPNYDQFANKIAFVLRDHGDLAGSDSARKLIRVLAEHVQSRQHDQTTTEPEAASVLHLALTIIVEIERMLTAATSANSLVLRFGVYRCPICRSRDLEEQEVVDHDYSDGQVRAMLVGWDLFCRECGWAKGP